MHHANMGCVCMCTSSPAPPASLRAPPSSFIHYYILYYTLLLSLFLHSTLAQSYILCHLPPTAIVYYILYGFARALSKMKIVFREIVSRDIKPKARDVVSLFLSPSLWRFEAEMGALRIVFICGSRVDHRQKKVFSR